MHGLHGLLVVDLVEKVEEIGSDRVATPIQSTEGMDATEKNLEQRAVIQKNVEVNLCKLKMPSSYPLLFVCV